MKAAIATLLTTAILARADVISTSEPPYPQITAAAASVKPATPVSDVKGLAFNRFFQVWLENTVSVDFRNFCIGLYVDISPGLQQLGCQLRHAVAGLAGNFAVRKHIGLLQHPQLDIMLS